MYKKFFLIACMFMTANLFGLDEKTCPEDGCELEEESCVFIDEDEKPIYQAKYRCPTCRRHYYDYEDRDIDATWPGKMEDSFRDSLTR